VLYYIIIFVIRDLISSEQIMADIKKRLVRYEEQEEFVWFNHKAYIFKQTTYVWVQSQAELVYPVQWLV